MVITPHRSDFHRTGSPFDLDFCVPQRKRGALRKKKQNGVVRGYLGRRDHLDCLAQLALVMILLVLGKWNRPSRRDCLHR